MPPTQRMKALAILTTTGRMSPRTFALSAVAVYLVSFLSQFLLAEPVMAQAGVVPFLVVQLVVAWTWYAVHVKRLRDADRSTAMALALTVLYLLAIMLLLLAMIAANASGQADGVDGKPLAAVFQIFLLLYLVGAVLSDPNLSMFGYVILGTLALVMLPIVVALAFSVWAGTRPRATAPP
jgi:uncharacterized membrane protein YhaH (DUF805 family)